MRTATGFEVSNPRELLFGFLRYWHPMYDGVAVPENNALRVSDIALSIMLNSRISGNTGADIWRARKPIEEQLPQIPTGIDLLDVPSGAPIPGEAGMSNAITALCNVRRCKLAVATKILHKKRPGLIPIFDSVVEGHYWPHMGGTVKGRSYGDYALAMTRLVHVDLLSVHDELTELRQNAIDNRTPMTGSRILNALIWIVGSGNEDWYRQV